MSKQREIWVCEELMQQGPHCNPLRDSDLTPEAKERVYQKVLDGELGVANDGTILEPIENFSTLEKANEAMLLLKLRNPKKNYRTVETIEVGRSG